MIIQKVPTSPQTSDQVIQVSLGNNPYLLRVMWNERFGYWSLSLSDITNSPIIENIKMVTMYDLTSRFKDKRMPYGYLAFVREKGPYKRPDYNDLGLTHNLYYLEDAEVLVEPAYGQPASETKVAPVAFQHRYPYPVPVIANAI